MRLTSELHPSQLEPQRLASIAGPFWVPEAKAVSPLMYLQRLAAQKLPSTDARHNYEAAPSTGADRVARTHLVEAGLEAEVRALDTLAYRIKYVLKETMGADGELERRQKELSLLLKREATEEEACTSIVESCAPGGFMRRYIEEGRLAFLHRNTLFVHGGVLGAGGGRTDCVGCVPGKTEQCTDMVQWVDELHAWKQAQIAEWVAQPGWADPKQNDPNNAAHVRGGRGLMDGYCVPQAKYPSVVMGRHLDGSGMPLNMPADVMLKLNKGGVLRLIVGHTPHGACPTVIRSGGPGMHAPGMTVVMADTSFSDMTAADNRGGAVAEVQIRSGDMVRVHGVLQDGTTRYDYIVQDDLLVGMQEPTGRMELSGTEMKMTETAGRRFVKAPIEGGKEYLMCHVSGFTT
eukprot:scaffold4206_cov48-Phaeocystis_antarctica.AAC.1